MKRNETIGAALNYPYLYNDPFPSLMILSNISSDIFPHLQIITVLWCISLHNIKYHFVINGMKYALMWYIGFVIA